MKRFLTVLMILALALVPALSLASEEAALTTYAQADGLYSFQYPDTWTLLSRDTIDQALDTARQVSDETLAGTLESYKDTLAQMDIVMLLSTDRQSNIVITYSNAGIALTGEQLLSLAPSFVAQYETMFSKFDATNPGSLMNAGENSYLLLEYDVSSSGMDMKGATCFCSPTENLFTLTLTAPKDGMDACLADYMQILTSMAFAK